MQLIRLATYNHIRPIVGIESIRYTQLIKILYI